MIKELINFDNNTISPKETILNAMKRLDEQELKVLFIVTGNKRLLASLTDGDIRRAILNGSALETSVDSISNNSPIAVDETTSYGEASEIMREMRISAVPVLDINGSIVRVLYKGRSVTDSNAEEVKTPVVIMAGGKGTRLYPYTKILPKPLIPIEDIPISERIINSFKKVGCNMFYMVVNYKKNMIKSYFSDVELNCSLVFVDEDAPLGTGGGLKLLEGRLRDTFVLTNCDILIYEDVKKIIRHHIEHKNDCTLVCSLKNYEIPYGVVNFSKGGEIESFEEKPKMSFFTNTGYYVLEPIVMEYINSGEVIGMPDIIERMRKDGLKVGIYPISEKAWLDMGQFDSMESMERRLKALEE